MFIAYLVVSLLLRVCLTLLCVMFIAYLVVSLLLHVYLGLLVAEERRECEYDRVFPWA
jgi:hypothetical protein